MKYRINPKRVEACCGGNMTLVMKSRCFSRVKYETVHSKIIMIKRPKKITGHA
jgi:hypothetical protein